MATRAKAAAHATQERLERTRAARTSWVANTGVAKGAGKAARFGGKRAASPPTGGPGHPAPHPGPPSKAGKASSGSDGQIARKMALRSSRPHDGGVRPTSPTYSESAYHVTYSQRATTAPEDANRSLRRDLAKIWAVIDDDRCAPAAAPRKREELLIAFLREPEVQALQAKAMKHMAEGYIAAGVSDTQMRLGIKLRLSSRTISRP
eukprot:SAG11_NODE_8274_length_1036_cov_2.113127_1_plen_206_part_00